ncbi:MAG TPA: DedA family protein [Gemmatimonadales bacterium]|nr:DedA family protein [Gemmatimonadales bacterium]
MHLEQLVQQYGLMAVFLGAALEGDFTLILAGVTAHLGYFSFPLAVLAGTLGSLIGDSLWYALGRARGPKFRAGRVYQRVGPRIERLARRFGPAQLLLARFVYGTKAASMVFWGLHGLPVLRFAVVDLVGAALGATVFGGIGYLVSGSATLLLGKVRRVQLWLLGALIVGVVVVFLIHWTAKKELHLENGAGEPETGDLP